MRKRGAAINYILTNSFIDITIKTGIIKSFGSFSNLPFYSLRKKYL